MSILPPTTITPGLEAPAAKVTMDTWRYLGDRDAADLAYCARFGVQKAPEPVMVLGGAWAYVLPPLRRTSL